MKKVSGAQEHNANPSTFRERLLFVIWLSGKVLGVENATQFAQAIGKGASQLSKWVNENPRPEWGSIRSIAEVVGISAAWLDDPMQRDAVEPAEFPEWLAARHSREAAAAKARRRKSGG